MPGKAGKGESDFPGAPMRAGGRRGASSTGRAGPRSGPAGARRASSTCGGGSAPLRGRGGGRVTFRGRRGGSESHQYSARGAGPRARMRRRVRRRGTRRAGARAPHTPPPRTAAISRNRPQAGSPAPTRCPRASPRKRRYQTQNTCLGGWGPGALADAGLVFFFLLLFSS